MAYPTHKAKDFYCRLVNKSKKYSNNFGHYPAGLASSHRRKTEPYKGDEGGRSGSVVTTFVIFANTVFGGVMSNWELFIQKEGVFWEDVGKIYEKLGNEDKATEVYLKFLDYCLKEAEEDVSMLQRLTRS